ncbi:uncharacterized protein DS421_12g355230 [Arachis hypogaea]|nr:uncharacterized protein DS421_12g355230 [Arachis hypogaea]
MGAEGAGFAKPNMAGCPHHLWLMEEACRGGFIRFVVWVTYLSADWLATVSLGTLANNQGDASTQDRNHALQTIWAPFLLLHLGGPDTITAYALEDNTLWLRHLLVFVSGIIKYAERTWVLRSASAEQLEESLLSAPAIQPPNLKLSYANAELEYVHRGYYLFPVLKRLYANLSLRQRTWEDADADLKQFIFKHLTQNKSCTKNKDLITIFSRNCSLIKLTHWHIATDICYHSRTEESEKDYREVSKRISNYMLYLLLLRPLMLPKWINRITHVRNTFREAIRILQREQLPVKDAASASTLLIQMYTQCHQPLEQLRVERLASLCSMKVAALLHRLKIREFMGSDCNVWIEMLTYAASQCEWEAHAQQLRRGGEFLTHVVFSWQNLV